MKATQEPTLFVGQQHIRLEHRTIHDDGPEKSIYLRLNFHTQEPYDQVLAGLVPIRIPIIASRLGCNVSPLVRSTFSNQKVDHTSGLQHSTG